VIKNLRTSITVIISLAIILLMASYNYQSTGQIDGLMNPYTWQTLGWLKDNAEDNAKLFFFYGDSYDQDGSLGNTHKRNTRVEISELSSVLQNKTFNRYTQTKELIESGTMLPYKKGLISYGLHLKDDKNITGRKERDICSFDYYIFDRFGRYPVLVQFNQLVANTLLQQNFTIVYQNDLSVILKNKQPGGKCFGRDDKITF